MPSLGSHMAHARGLANRLGHPYIEGDRGAFYLGSTAPDIRVLLRVDRRQTHFFELDVLEEQDSVAAMFEAHPELATAAQLDPSTRAFVAGYITHLLMDELYIQNVYRTLFGERSPRAGDYWAHVLDRALQYEMNRRELEDADAMREVRDALNSAPRVRGVPFIDDEALAEWHEVSAGFASQEPTWERFPRMMRVHLGRAGYSEEQIDGLGDDAEAIVAEAIEYVTEERVERYMEEAAEVALARLDDYLAASV